MRKFKHKPTFVEAIQYDGNLETLTKVCMHFPDNFGIASNDDSRPQDGVLCSFLSGAPEAIPIGAWIIKGVDGEPYLCSEEVFEESYETAE